MHLSLHRPFIKHAAAIALAVLFAANKPARADIIDITGGVPLDDLLASGDSFLVFDKLFTITGFDTMGIDPAGITVFPVDLGIDGGIGFDLVGPIVVEGDDDDHLGLAGLDGGGSSQFTLNYTVVITQPGFLISDLHLLIDGVAADNGDYGLAGGGGCDDDLDGNGHPDGSGVSVVETVSGAVMPPIELTVGVGDGNDAEAFALLDTPVLSVDVEKVATFFACGDDGIDDNGDEGSITVNAIRQSFTQVPEPTTLPLLLFGAYMLAGRRRRVQR